MNFSPFEKLLRNDNNKAGFQSGKKKDGLERQGSPMIFYSRFF